VSTVLVQDSLIPSAAIVDVAIPSQSIEPQVVTESAQLLPLTAERKLLCVDVLVRTGGNISKAAELLGTTRQNIHRWAQTDPVFRELFEHALEFGTDNLEESYYERAMKGSDRATEFLLKARRPEKYRDVQSSQTDVNTEVIASGIVNMLQSLVERHRQQQASASAQVVQEAQLLSTGSVDANESSEAK